MKKVEGQVYDAMKNAMHISELSGKEIPQAVRLSQTASKLLEEVNDAMKFKNVLSKRDVLAIENLNILLSNNDAFVLPYPYYFFLRDQRADLDKEENQCILKFPKVAYCSKLIGQRIYTKLYNYFSRYDLRGDEFTYIVGKTADSMHIAPHMFDLDKLLKDCDLPNS